MKKLSSNYKLISFLTGLFGCWAIQETIGITVRNPLTVVLFVCLYLLVAKVYEGRYSGGLRALFALAGEIISIVIAVAVGCVLNPGVSADFSSRAFKLLSLLMLIIGFYFLIRLCLVGILYVIRRKDFIKPENAGEKSCEKPLDKAGERKLLWISALVCLVCYIPYFLYEFPGIMTADSLVQYEQIIGRTALSNHHPVIHTLTIKLFYQLGMLVTGNPIYALSFYTVAHMIFISICNGVAVREIARIEGCINRKHILAALAFFALMPFNAVFAVTMWKDVPFAGIAVLLCCHLAKMFRKREEGISFWDFAIYSFLGILFSLYRSNAWIAFIAFIPFFVFAFRKTIVKALVSVALCLVVVIAIKVPLFYVFNISGPDFVESLSLPLQQVARVIVVGGKASDLDNVMIDACIDRQYVRELYVPWYADNMKELVRAGHPEVIEQNKAGYFGLWRRLFFNNPGDYMKAFYDLEGGYFYPDVPYTVADADGIMDNDMGLYPMPIIGGAFIKVKEILLKLSDFMPVYGWFFSIGMYTVALVISLVAAIRGKRMTLIHILMLLIVGTLLVASPVVDFRYAYAMILSMPLWVVAAFGKSIVKGDNNNDGTTDNGVHGVSSED